MAMQLMACKPENVISAKDVSQEFGISAALVAKVLQTLVRAGLIRSYHGMRGGYQLAKPADEISVAHVIEAIEGDEHAIVECQGKDHATCEAHRTCTIREPLSILQERIANTFSSMSVAELASPHQLVSVTIS